jgi:carboxyl-terminal processing protease
MAVRWAIVVALLLGTGAARAAEPAVSGKAFVEEFIGLAEKRDIFASGPQWDRVKAWARQSATATTDSLSAYPIVAEALKSTGDFHGGLGPTEENTNRYKARYGKLWAEPSARHPNSDFLDRSALSSSDIRIRRGRTARILIAPSVHTADDEQRYAATLFKMISSAPRGTCGYVIDLRGNLGGDMGPMLAGVSPLLGSTVVGGFSDKVDLPSHLRVDSGRVGEVGADGKYQQDFALKRIPHARRYLANVPVAVLLDDGVLSSGEIMAAAFHGRPRTRSFGTRTYGFTTLNSPYPMADGSQLYMATGFYMDRLGRKFVNGIPADIDVPTSGSKASQDVLAAAGKWLGRQPGCR